MIAQAQSDMSKKREEIDKLLLVMKESLNGIGKQLKREFNEATVELNWHREELTDILGFEDSVKGFDLEFMTDDSIDFLDIYS